MADEVTIPAPPKSDAPEIPQSPLGGAIPPPPSWTGPGAVPTHERNDTSDGGVHGRSIAPHHFLPRSRYFFMRANCGPVRSVTSWCPPCLPAPCSRPGR